jgi:hypothetical protein
MNFQLDSMIEILLSADNQRRTEAEKYLQDIITTSFEEAVDSFLAVMSHQNPNVRCDSCRLRRWEPFSSRKSISTTRILFLDFPRTS